MKPAMYFLPRTKILFEEKKIKTIEGKNKINPPKRDYWYKIIEAKNNGKTYTKMFIHKRDYFALFFIFFYLAIA